jgi:Type IV secretion system pilin
MNKVLKFVKEFGIPAVSLLLPLTTFAQLQGPGVSAPVSGISSIGAVQSTLCQVVNWMFYLLIVFAVVMVLVAAFKYLTAAGDPEKVKSASHTLLYAAVAVIVAIIAKAFPSLIGSFIGQSGASNGVFAC